MSCNELLKGLSQTILGQDQKLRWILAALISGRHVLLEDRPGTGKTTLAKCLSHLLQVDCHRVQFTPDLLPSDILGVSIFEPNRGEFSFHPGPIFCQVLLADEINRSSPRTQAALLEAMAEGQVTVEGQTRALDEVFFVIATQNPVHYSGTYPLPEAQLDRFGLQFDLGYLNTEEEFRLVTGKLHSPRHDLEAICQKADILEWRQEVQNIKISDDLVRYVVKLVDSTRHHENVQQGASPRASIDLVEMSRALAFIDGKDFVGPDLIKELALPCLSHRLVIDPMLVHSGRSGKTLIEEALASHPLPL